MGYLNVNFSVDAVAIVDLPVLPTNSVHARISYRIAGADAPVLPVKHPGVKSFACGGMV